jgi:protein-tyrosine phosphatase
LIRNLRDVGGCETTGGKVVRRGLVFRSAAFTCDPLSGNQQALEELGVRRILDLRTVSEVEESPAPDLPASVERLHRPFLVSIENRSFQPIDRSPPATAGRYYEYLVEGRSSVAAVVSSLVTAPSEPTLVHCVAGRDRTGIVVACLLSVLGVPDDRVASDYAESHVMDDAEGRHAHPDNIVLLLRTVRERHGSVESFLAEGRADGLPVDALRDAFLEPGPA